MEAAPEDYRRALPLLRRVGALSAERGQPDRRRSSATEPTGRPPEPTTPPPPTAPADFRRCAKNETIVPFFREKPGFFWEKCCTKELFGALTWCCQYVTRKSVPISRNVRRDLAAPCEVSGERNGCRCCIFKRSGAERPTTARRRTQEPPPKESDRATATGSGAKPGATTPPPKRQPRTRAPPGGGGGGHRQRSSSCRSPSGIA